MKILIRQIGNEHYVWKDATYTKSGFVVDNSIIKQTNVVSILNDNRSQYVKCAVCGEMFRKGSKKWEQHIQKTEDTSKCFACQYLRTRNVKQINKKYVLQDNGRYVNTTKVETDLVCSCSYDYFDIGSENARSRCVYNRCVNANANVVSDFFTNNKGAFDDIITVDRILKNGYTLRQQGEYTKYKLKARQTIYAVVNNKNIVDHFRVSYKDFDWVLYYSKKFDKLYFRDNYNTYQEWNPYWQLERDSIENIHKKIAALYD